MTSWKDFLTKVVTTFREEFKKFDPPKQKLIRERGFDELLLEPCQIEVLDYGVGKAVVMVIIHDKAFPDMMFKIHKNVKSLDVSEFAKRYKSDFSFFLEEKYTELLQISGDSLHILSKDKLHIAIGRHSEEEVAELFLASAKKLLRTEQVDVIERSANGLRKSIAKIPEKDIRDELLATTRKIDASLQEVKRLDEEIGKVRQLVGVTKEIQDWKLLVTDVDKLKGEHVAREVFETHIKRLDEKIDKGLESLVIRIDKGLEALNTRIEDLKAIKFWSKRTLLEIALFVWGAVVTLYVAGVIKF